MSRKIIITFICLFVTFFQSCGNLLEEPGQEPTLEQKLRGIWIVGGLSSQQITTGTASAVSGVDLYDPVKNVWYQNVTSVPIPVSFAGVASCGGKIYVIGGFDVSGNPRSTVQIYDVSTNTWSNGLDIYINLTYYTKANINAVAIDSKIYFMGGTITAYSAWETPITNQVFEYDTVTNTWALKEQIAPFPEIATSRANMNIMASRDIIYFLGGRSSASTPSNLHEGYIAYLDLATSATETVIAPPYCAGFASALYSPSAGPAIMITIGGVSTFTNVTGSYVFFDDVSSSVAATMVPKASYLYSPFTGTGISWENTTNQYPNSVGFASAAIYGSKVYCFGGVNTFSAGSDLSIYQDVYCFDLTNLTAGNWVKKADMPVARYGHSAITIEQ